MKVHPELVESEQHLVYLLGVERVLLDRAQPVRAHNARTDNSLHAHPLRNVRSARTVVHMETETIRTATATARRIVTGLLLGAAVAVFLMAQLLSPSTAEDTAATGPDPRADVAAETAAALITAHDCWTGEAPADMVGQIPGHVVARGAHQHLPVYSARLVGPALDRVFGQGHEGLTVYAFCR